MDDDLSEDLSPFCGDADDGEIEGFGGELPPIPVCIPGMFGCEPLQDGWICKFDPASKKPYFIKNGREPTWNLPFYVDPRKKFSKVIHPDLYARSYWTNGFENTYERPSDELIHEDVVPSEPTSDENDDDYEGGAMFHPSGGPSLNSPMNSNDDGDDGEDGLGGYYMDGVSSRAGAAAAGANVGGSEGIEDLKDWVETELDDGRVGYYKDGEFKFLGEDGRLHNQ